MGTFCRFCVISIFLISTPAVARTLNADGSISCGPGMSVVFWQEDNGMSEGYRAIFVTPPGEGYLVRHYPALDSVTVYHDGSTGTNIPWRALRPVEEGETSLVYRFLDVAPPDGFDYVGNATVKALLVSMELYYPVCALNSFVDEIVSKSR